MTTTTTARTRKPQTRTAKVQHLEAATILWLTVGHETTAYKLTRLSSDFGTAYRLMRADKGDGQGSETYDVNLQAGGRSTCECECKGHLRWSHKTECKHIACLFQLQKQGKI
jgi:hypothetical protein